MRIDRYEWLLKALESKYAPKVCLQTGTITGVKAWQGQRGRLRVTLCFTGEKKKYDVHEVIAVAGGLNPVEVTVNHKDGDHINNSFANLEVITNLENKRHAVENGLICRGSASPNTKLLEEDVKAIKKLLADGEQGRKIAEMFGVTESIVSRIKRGQTWKHIN